MNKANVMRSQIKGTKVKCYNPDCGHEWEYRGDMIYGCCPSCRRNTKIEIAKLGVKK